MKTEAMDRATMLDPDPVEEALEPRGPRHSYGLRSVGGGLYVVVRVTPEGEETISRPNRRGVAMGALVNRIEEDGWL